MAQVLTENFTQRLYASPSSQKQNKPTIFDELRWAMQHSQKPLEQITQLIAELHGAYTGMTPILAEFLNIVNCGESSASINNAIELLNQVNSLLRSSIGRRNNINCSQMSVPLLREFISKCSAIHPSVNNYIQNNIGKFPFFQQISDDVATFGKIVLQRTDIPALDRILSGGMECMMTNSRLKRKTADLLIPAIARLADEPSNMLDVLFLRSMNKQNNMSMLKPQYGKSGNGLAHGHNFTMDAFNAKRNKDAIRPCLNNVANKFGALLQLDNVLFPVKQGALNKQSWHNLSTGIVDGFNRPVMREVEIPTAAESKKTSKP
jgi:hypothetical protein